MKKKIASTLPNKPRNAQRADRRQKHAVLAATSRRPRITRRDVSVLLSRLTPSQLKVIRGLVLELLEPLPTTAGHAIETGV